MPEDQVVQRHLHAIMEHREKIFALTQIRKAMGGFDANADTILTILNAVSSILDYQVAKAEGEKRPRK